MLFFMFSLAISILLISGVGTSIKVDMTFLQGYDFVATVLDSSIYWQLKVGN